MEGKEKEGEVRGEGGWAADRMDAEEEEEKG